MGVANTMSGLGTAGKLFSITCITTGADSLKARFNFTLIAQRNNSVVKQENSSNKYLNHTFTAQVSDAGNYTCNVTVTSTFLDKPVILNAPLTLTIQSKSNQSDTTLRGSFFCDL